MPKGRNSKRRSVEPTYEMRNFITYDIEPEDILEEEDYIEKMLIVRYRIISVFEHSIDPATQKGVYGNYLVGIGPRLTQLNRFLASKVSYRGLLSRSDLPRKYQALNYKWRDLIMRRITRCMIERQVNLLKESCDLWWLDYHGGIWEISQSVADEQKLVQASFATIYDSEYRLERDSKPRYRDERSHHGRPSKQSRRRDSLLRQAPGASIGTSGF